ncbi:ABC transporter ATP-binding protein [Pseudonocardia sp. CA-107938]|uniref:ABC transporter ATP-binding protein n=1 Tax=Pseudonocardia sp. CA-107938 TaxID=3240021 RepID=UPI003D931C58
MASVELDRLVVQYGTGAPVLDGLDLRIADGEFFVLVGPSGCGKSTVLRMLAGLERPTSGAVRIGGADVTAVPAHDRDVAMVFQNYAIYPHMTVRRNIGYGLRVRGADRATERARVEEVGRLLGLDALLDRRPATLSGGQLQRVAMGRAIARNPQVFLMDEPLSNLDAKLRVSMRAELERLHRSLGVTTVYVTHDQVEAMTLGQRAAVLRGGVLQQVDSPQQLYDRPANAFVAAFLGSPPMNLAAACWDGQCLVLGGTRLPVPEPVRPPLPPGSRVIVGIRPEDLTDARRAPGYEQLKLRCLARQNLGSDVLLHVALDAEPADVAAVERLTRSEHAPSDDAELRPGAGTLCARVGTGFAAADGELVDLSVRITKLHWFDPDTGERLDRWA